jgi:hypothetical protein
MGTPQPICSSAAGSRRSRLPPAFGAECETLLESMALTQAAWSRARARLAELEAMRDALGEELEAMDEREEQTAAEVSDTVMSAA